MSGTPERGSATLELAIIGPALIVLLAVVIAAGRIQVAGGAVEQAAAAGAREASIARTPAAAAAIAEAAATRVLTQQDLDCVALTVTTDTSGYAVPVGQVGQVGATVTCVVPLSDLGVPVLPGARTLTAQSTSVLDRYRGR
jgi:Flp pilus assembly protein TadG